MPLVYLLPVLYVFHGMVINVILFMDDESLSLLGCSHSNGSHILVQMVVIWMLLDSMQKHCGIRNAKLSSISRVDARRPFIVIGIFIFHFYRNSYPILMPSIFGVLWITFYASEYCWQFQKIKDAIITHNTDRCSIGPPTGVGDLNFETSSAPKDTQVGSSTT